MLAATDWIGEGTKHQRKDDVKEFARGKVLLRIGSNDYVASVVVGTSSDGSAKLYDIINLSPTTIKEMSTAIAENPSPGADRNTVPISGNSISESGDFVNRENSLSSAYTQKQEQLDIIEQTNPAPNSYSAWVRTVEDIKTLSEALADPEWADYDEFNPDLTRADIESAIGSGKITVYSSYPIKSGVFVSPSRMEAESYSGTGKVYQKQVGINDVAWLDPTQGQYAPVQGNRQFSLSEENSEQGIRDEDVFYERGISDEDTAAELERENAVKNASDAIRGEIVESKGKMTKAEAAKEKRLQKMKEKADYAQRNPLENMTEKDAEVLGLMKADQDAQLAEIDREFYERAKEFSKQIIRTVSHKEDPVRITLLFCG